MNPPPARPTPSPARRLGRFLVPVVVGALALGGFAVAQAETGGGGTDSPRDLLERSATTTTRPAIEHPEDVDRSGDVATPLASLTSLPDHGPSGPGGPGTTTVTRVDDEPEVEVEDEVEVEPEIEHEAEHEAEHEDGHDASPNRGPGSTSSGSDGSGSSGGGHHGSDG